MFREIMSTAAKESQSVAELGRDTGWLVAYWAETKYRDAIFYHLTCIFSIISNKSGVWREESKIQCLGFFVLSAEVSLPLTGVSEGSLSSTL